MQMKRKPVPLSYVVCILTCMVGILFFHEITAYPFAESVGSQLLFCGLSIAAIVGIVRYKLRLCEDERMFKREEEVMRAISEIIRMQKRQGFFYSTLKHRFSDEEFFIIDGKVMEVIVSPNGEIRIKGPSYLAHVLSCALFKKGIFAVVSVQQNQPPHRVLFLNCTINPVTPPQLGELRRTRFIGRLFYSLAYKFMLYAFLYEINYY